MQPPLLAILCESSITESDDMWGDTAYISLGVMDVEFTVEDDSDMIDELDDCDENCDELVPVFENHGISSLRSLPCRCLYVWGKTMCCGGCGGG